MSTCRYVRPLLPASAAGRGSEDVFQGARWTLSIVKQEGKEREGAQHGAWASEGSRDAG